MNSLSTRLLMWYAIMWLLVTILVAGLLVYSSISRRQSQDDSTKKISKERVAASTSSGVVLVCEPTPQSPSLGASLIYLSCNQRLTGQMSLWNGQITVLIHEGLQPLDSGYPSALSVQCGSGTGCKAILERDLGRSRHFFIPGRPGSSETLPTLDCIMPWTLQ